jgi:FkbM family methyltransferase
MNATIQQLHAVIASSAGQPDFLEVLFGEHRHAATVAPVALFGAGALGAELGYALQRVGVSVAYHCDNDPRKQGTTLAGRPVVSIEALAARAPDALVVIAVASHGREAVDQLTRAGFEPGRILRKPGDADAELLAMYAMVGTQRLYEGCVHEAAPGTILEYLERRGADVHDACTAFADERSRALYVAKLAVFASGLHFAAFKAFMLQFSDAIRDFGLLGYRGTPEDHYYFRNELFEVDDGEVYLDVGAYDGDSVESFVEACARRGVRYAHIDALEPDPAVFRRLRANLAHVERVSLHPIGLWSETTTLEFVSSAQALHDQSGSVSAAGDIRVPVMSLDEFVRSGPPGAHEVTLLKMDPSGVVARAVLEGALETLSRRRPKLAIGIYHSLDEFIDVPLLMRERFSEYTLMLRHGTYHLCDTDLYGVVRAGPRVLAATDEPIGA